MHATLEPPDVLSQHDDDTALVKSRLVACESERRHELTRIGVRRDEWVDRVVCGSSVDEGGWQGVSEEHMRLTVIFR